jgi:hypothetical protein
MAYLKSVPSAPNWLPQPRSGHRFRVTLWFDPGEYFLLMQQAAEVQPGKLSLQKWVLKALHLVDAAKKAAKVDGRVAAPVLRHINRERDLAVAARRVRKPRKVAA